MTCLLLTSRPSFTRQAFERPVRILGEGGPEFSFVPLVERPLANPRRPSGNLASDLIAANKLPHHFGTLRTPAAEIFLARLGKAETGLEMGEHALSKIQQKRLNSWQSRQLGPPA